jgi:hypothetical protein
MARNSQRSGVSPENVKAFLAENNITRQKAVELCRASDRTFRYWLSGQIPFPFGEWELLQIKIQFLKLIARRNDGEKISPDDAINIIIPFLED